MPDMKVTASSRKIGLGQGWQLVAHYRYQLGNNYRAHFVRFLNRKPSMNSCKRLGTTGINLAKLVTFVRSDESRPPALCFAARRPSTSKPSSCFGSEKFLPTFRQFPKSRHFVA